MSASQERRALPLPTGRGWWLVAAGVASGLLVFLWLWSGQRDEASAPDTQPPAAVGPVFAPLPAPSTEGLADAPAPPSGPVARIDEPPAPPPAAATQAGPGEPLHEAGPGGPASTPVAVHSPAPRYPGRALRRGESGEVVLRVAIDASGRPARIDVAASSGSRDLDRAALTAVRRWRFRPAMQGDRPVEAVVDVPISFEGRR